MYSFLFAMGLYHVETLYLIICDLTIPNTWGEGGRIYHANANKAAKEAYSVPRSESRPKKKATKAGPDKLG